MSEMGVREPGENPFGETELPERFHCPVEECEEWFFDPSARDGHLSKHSDELEDGEFKGKMDPHKRGDDLQDE